MKKTMNTVVLVLVVMWSFACKEDNKVDVTTGVKIADAVVAQAVAPVVVPAVVPVTEKQATLELDHLNSDVGSERQKVQSQEFRDMTTRARHRYGDVPMTFAIIGTDSVNRGLDNWRMCANFGLVQLGLPDDTIAEFYDQNGTPCEKNPTGYVAQIFVLGLKGAEEQIITPTHKTEKMVIVIPAVIDLSFE